MHQISILGTGEYGRAMAARLEDAGLSFTMGSRDPSQRIQGYRHGALTGVQIQMIDEAILNSDIIIIAMHPCHYESLICFQNHLQGKILVDISNEVASESSAEILSDLFPRSTVIKGFNTISAKEMASFSSRGHPVNICGDDYQAKHVVFKLAKRMGFIPVDCGPLQNSKHLEHQVNRLFPNWGSASLVVLVISVIWLIYTFSRHLGLREDPYSADRIPTNIMNKVTGAIAMTCLCAVYIPGSILAFIQLHKKSKNVKISMVLDLWMNMRQKLGLFALLFASIHTLLSLSLMSPAYYKKWFHSTYTKVVINGTTEITIPLPSRMNWIGEVCVFLGVLAMVALLVVGLGTLPSISRSLSRREWRFVHNYISLFCLFMASAHVTVKGASGWSGKQFIYVIITMACLNSIISWFTLLLRLILYIPCVYKRLDKIRRGIIEKTENKESGSEKAPTYTENDREMSIVV